MGFDGLRRHRSGDGIQRNGLLDNVAELCPLVHLHVCAVCVDKSPRQRGELHGQKQTNAPTMTA